MMQKGGRYIGKKQRTEWLVRKQNKSITRIFWHKFLLSFFLLPFSTNRQCRRQDLLPSAARHHYPLSYAITMARTSIHAIVLLFLFLHLSSAQPELDALLQFKASLTNNAAALYDWAAPTPPCTDSTANWIGLICENGAVGGLHLQNMGLGGAIDVHALAQLPNLNLLSLAANSFAGPLPNLAALRNLRVVSLSNNKMSGAIPADAFVGMTALVQLDLNDNQFSGEIPTLLADLPALQDLMLQNNMFQGGLPQFRVGQLKNLSVVNNNLAGEIPPGLSHFDASAFLG